MKKIIICFFVLFSSVFLCGATDRNYVIDAEANAARHNNMGIRYLQEKYYFGAIKEFEIAINLNPNSQAAAVYFNNLGRTYMIIGYPELAETKFRMALRKYPLNFEYYINLVESYGKQNILSEKLKYHKKMRKSNLDDITIALLYGALGQTKTEVTLLDEFCNNEPDLIITPAIRKYVFEQAKYIQYSGKNLK